MFSLMNWLYGKKCGSIDAPFGSKCGNPRVEYFESVRYVGIPRTHTFYRSANKLL